MIATFKTLVKSALSDPFQFGQNYQCECLICGHKGRFYSFGTPARRAARCPNCLSLERHRLYARLMKEHPELTRDKSILHFAPENAIRSFMMKHAAPADYKSADLEPGVADTVEDMTALSLKDESLDCTIANHVLEHIPADTTAMGEVYRVLKPGGTFLCSVPIVQAWEKSYENPAIITIKDRIRHFAQHNHVRMYGRDFKERLQAAGFTVEEYQAPPEDCIRYGLSYGEIIFICRK